MQRCVLQQDRSLYSLPPSKFRLCEQHLRHTLTSLLQLDAEFPARAASLAKFEQWSYNITTLRLMVPRTAFFYKSQQGDPTAKSGNTFSAMAATAEFKSALGLLTTLPRCNTILLQHETLSSWRLCAFECNRRIVRDRTIAVLDVVMRENLEVCC
jgi:hypothetical protein